MRSAWSKCLFPLLALLASAAAFADEHAGTVKVFRQAGGYQKGMATFTVAKGGLMHEATVGGQKFSYKPKK